MPGKILTSARKDAFKIISKLGFQEDIKIETPDGSRVLELTGQHSKHWVSFDTDGNPINSKNAHITISEAFLTENEYPVRNPLSGEVDLLQHRVYVKDATLIEKSYIITENFPSETFGLIVCIISTFE